MLAVRTASNAFRADIFYQVINSTCRVLRYLFIDEPAAISDDTFSLGSSSNESCLMTKASVAFYVGKGTVVILVPGNTFL
jgi:hypothetical protein